MSEVYWESNEWANKAPLKYQRGSEVAKTITLYASTVAVDTKLRRRLSPGSFLVKITSGTGINKYGPYDKTVSDGRESPAIGGVAFNWEAVDCTLGDRACAGLYIDCIFDMSELTMNGCSLHGTPLTNLKSYFPTCVFED